MTIIAIEGLPSAAPAEDSWPFENLGGDTALGLRVDEIFARQLDTGFAGEVRGLVTDPATGLAGKDPEAALARIAGTLPLLAELKDRYLGQAQGPRQKALLEPLIDRRLDRAGGDLGRIAAQATSALDDRSVAERLADLRQDASLSWHDPAHLRLLGRTTVDELRYQGERKGWDAGRTDSAVRTGLSDLYAGAVEAAIVQNPERAATLYDHARDVIQPERQAAVERRIERAREERRVTEIVGGLGDMPDDPARRPDLDDYQVRAVEATPPDASPEVRAQVTRMARIEHARADRAWQAARGRAATGALDWLGENPAAPLMAMPTELRDGLSPEQTKALDRTAMNGGRVVTDRDLYDTLDDQAVRNPEEFTSLDLTQYRLSLADSDYDRLTKLQQALSEGKSDPAFERHRLGRLFLEEGLRTANLDPNGEEARTARQQLDRLLGAFESVEGKPPTMADIRGLVDDVLPRTEGDPNIVRVLGDDPVEALPQEVEAENALDGGEPRIAYVDDGSGEVGEFFDPQHIILAQAGGGGARGGGGGHVPPPPRSSATPGQQPAPGIGHNRPPLIPGLPQAIENYRRWFSPSSQPSGTQPIPDTAGAAAAAEQRPSTQSLSDWLDERAQLAKRDEYVGPDGIDTAVGIKLDPRVGEPASGRDYLPANENHRKGIRGEYGLANDIARHFPDHTVIDFGRKAGQRGPDVISVDRNGGIHFWDSKWRGSDTSIGPSSRAHQTPRSLCGALEHAEITVYAAMKSGRLSPEASARALENLVSRNVTIVTVGTGSARNGVVERIAGDKRAVVYPERRP
ncbi:hypothetical protein [uncultured Reyranella sp.]|uniref:hypothetical protein n=1 Tax=uncultured Reyranella sp. TaxID=735512 RepID=UPI00259CF26B|nr:hypothetical protein [uncultured Reyranella sp.]